jgi:hypothetical protein
MTVDIEIFPLHNSAAIPGKYDLKFGDLITVVVLMLRCPLSFSQHRFQIGFDNFFNSADFCIPHQIVNLYSFAFFI